MCPYCEGSKRIRDDLIVGHSRIIQSIHGTNELWTKLILPKHKEYRTMQYIGYCPMCGRKLI